LSTGSPESVATGAAVVGAEVVVAGFPIKIKFYVIIFALLAH
jgi:hypothetical protein